MSNPMLVQRWRDRLRDLRSGIGRPIPCSCGCSDKDRVAAEIDALQRLIERHAHLPEQHKDAS